MWYYIYILHKLTESKKLSNPNSHMNKWHVLYSSTWLIKDYVISNRTQYIFNSCSTPIIKSKCFIKHIYSREHLNYWFYIKNSVLLCNILPTSIPVRQVCQIQAIPQSTIYMNHSFSVQMKAISSSFWIIP